MQPPAHNIAAPRRAVLGRMNDVEAGSMTASRAMVLCAENKRITSHGAAIEPKRKHRPHGSRQSDDKNRPARGDRLMPLTNVILGARLLLAVALLMVAARAH